MTSEAPDITIPVDTSDERTVRRSSGTARYVAGKVGGAAVSLLMVVLLGFFSFRLLPGDPVRRMARERPMGPEQIAQLRAQYGLDKPLAVQFFDYLRGIVTGNLGESYVYQQPVSSLIAQYFWPTILLTGSAAVLAISVGLWLGQLAGWRHGSTFDKVTTGVSLVFWSVPTFWLGLILLMVFAGTWHIFPTAGFADVGLEPGTPAYVLSVIRHLVLPVITMAAVVYAQYVLTMRASVMEERDADYLLTARAKGLQDDLVRRRHAIPNALLPTVTLVFMHVGGLIGGAVTVEAVFSWPGLGMLTYEALQGPDLPLLQGTFVVFSSIVIVMNLVADLVYRRLDPRVRQS